jgi:hypothetical protein
MSIADIVEPHAERLEKAADQMEAAGLGLHPEEGHVHHLRRMASHLPADAALGRLADRYDPNRMHAAAAAQDVAVPASVAKILAGADIRPPARGAKLNVHDVDDKLARAGVPLRDRLWAKQALQRIGFLAA